MIILHAADLHFGKAHRPEAAEALLHLADEVDADAVVIAGDLTKRAKKREYLAAKDFLARLAPRPVIVTMGNHDVPLYRIWERLLAPYAKFRRYIGETQPIRDIHKECPLPARFAALNSSAPYSAIVNGRITRTQLSHAALAFAFAPGGEQGVLRILVLHHALVDPGDGERVQPFPDARKMICHARGWGVDLILSGHIHRSHLGCGVCDPESFDADRAFNDPFRFVPLREKRGIPVLIAGTASSLRGRGPERGMNSVNVIVASDSEMEAVVYLYSDKSKKFERWKSRRYPRQPSAPGLDPRESAGI